MNGFIAVVALDLQSASFIDEFEDTLTFWVKNATKNTNFAVDIRGVIFL